MSSGYGRETTFHHKEIKAMYTVQVNKWFEGKRKIYAKIINRESIQRIKNTLARARKRIEANEVLSKVQQKALSKYEVIRKFKRRQYMLIKKRSSPNDPVCQYLPCEDSFEEIASVHLSSEHGNLRTVKSLMRSRYVVSKKCIALVIKLCNVCALRKQVQKKKQYNQACHIFINKLNVTSNTTSHFEHLLIVVDKVTSFTHIRPIVSIDSSEIAIELFKIFMDFGPPLVIETNEEQYFQDVIDIVQMLSPVCKVAINKPMNKLKDWITIVTALLEDWMKAAGSDDWAMGCHMVQWTLNNNMNYEICDTPYRALFRESPKFLKPYWNSVEALKMLKNYATKRENNVSGKDMVTDKKTEIEPGTKIIGSPRKAVTLENLDTDIEINEPFEIDRSLPSVQLDVGTESVTSENSDDLSDLIVLNDKNECCNICKLIVTDPCVCDECLNLIHRHCGKSLDDDESPVICNSCAEKKQRLINMKRSIAEIEQKLRDNNILRN